MTKDEIIEEIVNKTSIKKDAVEACVEGIMQTIKSSMSQGENVYLRGFGTFLLKTRAKKIGRNISKGTAVTIPAHVIPAFKPGKEFIKDIKKHVKVK